MTPVVRPKAGSRMQTTTNSLRLIVLDEDEDGDKLYKYKYKYNCISAITSSVICTFVRANIPRLYRLRLRLRLRQVQ